MGLINPMHTTNFQVLRRWLFKLCQSRSGQCLRQSFESGNKPARDPD